MTLFKSIGIILVFIISIIEGCQPLARYGHGSIVLGNKLYFFGGYVKETNGNEIIHKNTNDFFYIDLSKSFNTLNPQYIDLTTTTRPPVRFSQGSLIPNNQGNGFYTIGGVLNNVKDPSESFYNNFIYEFDETTMEWTVPRTVNSQKSFKLKEFNPVPYNKNVYIFGGINDDDLEMISEMQIFNSESLSWSLASNNIPNLETLFGYTATLLPDDGIIVYIGGYFINSGHVASNSLSDIYTYDTRNDKWNYIKTDAQGIDPRSGHTAVLASDNQIIVYGGSDNSAEALPQLVVLDTNSYEWVTPNTAKIESRELHTANMVGDYMIVSFGIFSSSESNDFSNEIKILDTRTYEWVDSISFEPTNILNFQSFKKRDEPQSDENKKDSFFTKVPKYTQMVIFCFAGLLVITIIFLTYYSIRQKRKKAKSKHASVLPYTNCGEEAKEDIIYEYVK